MDDFLANRDYNGSKGDTQDLFAGWVNFKDEIHKVFSQIDEEARAEKAITHIKQTKSVSAYTAEFRQLQSRIDWDDATLRTVYEKGLKEVVKDALVHHEPPKDLHGLIELATRINNRIYEREQQKKKVALPIPNTKKHRTTVQMDRTRDVIMTGNVKNASRKPQRYGISKEERQRRFENKVYL